MARTPLLDIDPQLYHQELVKIIQRGLPIADACNLVGIKEATFYYWMRIGEREERQPYLKFFEDVTRARKQGRLNAIERVHKAMNDEEDKRTALAAAQWYLERSDPENWGRKSKQTVEINMNQPLLAKFVSRCDQLGLNPNEVMTRFLDRLEAQMEPEQLADGD